MGDPPPSSAPGSAGQSPRGSVPPSTPLTPNDREGVSPTVPSPSNTSAARRKSRKILNNRRTTDGTSITVFNMMERFKSERQKEMDRKERKGERVKFSVLQKSKDSLCHLETALKKEKVLQPDSSWRQIWDTLILVFILYYWIFVPMYYVAERSDIFLTPPVQIALESIATILFCVDIYLGFNTAAIDKTGLTVHDPARIRETYLTGQFTWDFLSGLPFDLFILFTAGEDRMHLFLLVSHLRLFKIFRYPSLFTIVSSMRLEAQVVQFHYSIIPNVKMCFKCIVSLHLITVLFMAINKSDDFVLAGKEEDFTYTTSLYWTLYTVSSVGYGDIPVDTPWKRRFASLLCVVGVVLHGVVISEVTMRMQKGDVASERRDKMKETFNILKEFSIPDELQKEVFAFQYHQLHSSLGGQFMSVLETLPGSMRNRIDLYVRVKFICKVPMFAQQDFNCLVALANGLKSLVFEPEQTIIKAGDEGAEMYFLAHGFGDVLAPTGEHLDVIHPGGFFGEVALLTEAKRNATIRALTYCDLFQLRKDKFKEIVRTFPELEATVRQEVAKRIPKPVQEDDSAEPSPVNNGNEETATAASSPHRSSTHGANINPGGPVSFQNALQSQDESRAMLSDGLSSPHMSDLSGMDGDSPSRADLPSTKLTDYRAFDANAPSPPPVMRVTAPPSFPASSRNVSIASAVPDHRLSNLENKVDNLAAVVHRIEHLLTLSLAAGQGKPFSGVKSDESDTEVGPTAAPRHSTVATDELDSSPPRPPTADGLPSPPSTRPHTPPDEITSHPLLPDHL
eukprot:Rhum_TRINITY_DN23210_c0_g1::Rhum_TRINITY_DN23210_c0_g1_i1::g.177454::m.177454/K04910/KCNH7; potassium voltage-gated channel Eag-related subfamily H member 7